jgi:hypothetical protein
VDKPEIRRPLGRPRHRLKDNVKIDLQEVGRGGMDSNDLAVDRDRRRARLSAVIWFHKMRGIA